MQQRYSTHFAAMLHDKFPFFCCPFNRTLSADKGMNVKSPPKNVVITFQCHADILTVSAPHVMVVIVCVINNL